MSKVQSPKSDFHDAPISSRGGESQRDVADIGPWTLDVGLRVQDLRKSFLAPSGDKIDVLRGVSFSSQPGESIAVVGSSGAGKSTLLHLLAGIERPNHGSIQAGKTEVDNASQSELAAFRNQSVGLVFQFHHLLKDLTALENVSLPLMMQRQPKARATSTARSLLQSQGLGDRCEHYVGDLSGGEQQRVAVCRALITRPHLVLADEPTGNLDAAVGEEIVNSLTEYARQTPAIVIMVTHNSMFADKCDRQFRLEQGRLKDIR